METAEFETLVVEAIESLPEDFLRLMDNVEVVVEEWPTPRQLRSVGLRHPASLLGLYEGIPLTRRGHNYGLVLPDKVTIFQRPIERICSTDEEVCQQVQDTVIHELGHHFGIGEGRMRELERERNMKRRAVKAQDGQA
ncbi:MAG TPA: metallopeptidase family protein [Ardenticatenaceae bacterium]|jgi:predicted Zn-dependent protease with MMP-like domain